MNEAAVICDICGINYYDFPGYKFHRLERNGKLMGVWINKGNEVHVAVYPEFKGKWFGKKELRTLIKLIEEYGILITSVRKENIAGQRFVERIGFKKAGSIDDMFNYTLGVKDVFPENIR